MSSLWLNINEKWKKHGTLQLCEMNCKVHCNTLQYIAIHFKLHLKYTAHNEM